MMEKKLRFPDSGIDIDEEQCWHRSRLDEQKYTNRCIVLPAHCQVVFLIFRREGGRPVLQVDFQILLK